MMLMPYCSVLHKHQFKTVCRCLSFKLSDRFAWFVLLVLSKQGTDAKGEKIVVTTAQDSGKQGRQMIWNVSCSWPDKLISPLVMSPQEMYLWSLMQPKVIKLFLSPTSLSLPTPSQAQSLLPWHPLQWKSLKYLVSWFMLTNHINIFVGWLDGWIIIKL